MVVILCSVVMSLEDMVNRGGGGVCSELSPRDILICAGYKRKERVSKEGAGNALPLS